MVLILGVVFLLLGFYLIGKAATSKNLDVVFYCGISAILSFIVAGISFSLSLT